MSEVVKVGDGLDGEVDGVAAPAALTKDLPVFEPGEDVFDASALFLVGLPRFGSLRGGGVVTPGSDGPQPVTQLRLSCRCSRLLCR